MSFGVLLLLYPPDGDILPCFLNIHTFHIMDERMCSINKVVHSGSHMLKYTLS